jgi:hypothetical protein
MTGLCQMKKKESGARIQESGGVLRPESFSSFVVLDKAWHVDAMCDLASVWRGAALARSPRPRDVCFSA